jgi:hypothetical protein
LAIFFMGKMVTLRIPPFTVVSSSVSRGGEHMVHIVSKSSGVAGGPDNCERGLSHNGWGERMQRQHPSPPCTPYTRF